jgi:hypothetical protein
MQLASSRAGCGTSSGLVYTFCKLIGMPTWQPELLQPSVLLALDLLSEAPQPMPTEAQRPWHETVK